MDSDPERIVSGSLENCIRILGELYPDPQLWVAETLEAQHAKKMLDCIFSAMACAILAQAISPKEAGIFKNYNPLSRNSRFC